MLFDGALNVQKASEVVGAKCLRSIFMLQGAEHVTSLFFLDIAKINHMQLFIKLCRVAHSWFGRGSRHALCNIFTKHLKVHNKGRKCGLIRATDVRMGGHLGADMFGLYFCSNRAIV